MRKRNVKIDRPKRKSAIKETAFKIIFGIALIGTVASPPASSIAEAKTYNTTYEKSDSVAAKMKNEISQAIAAKKDKTVTIKVNAKGKSIRDAVGDIEMQGFTLDILLGGEGKGFIGPDKKKLTFNVDGIKVGKTKKLGKYVVASLKKTGAKSVSLTYKITVKKKGFTDLEASGQEWIDKTVTEVEKLIKEDSELGKIAAFFEFCGNKRDLGALSALTEAEKLYKAPKKTIVSYKTNRDKIYPAAEWTVGVLKGLGLNSYMASDKGLLTSSAVKLNGKQWFVNPDVRTLVETNKSGGTDLQLYWYDGKIHTCKSFNDYVNNEVEVFERNDAEYKRLTEEYNEYENSFYIDGMTDEEYKATFSSWWQEFQDLLMKKFPLLVKKPDTYIATEHRDFTDESVKLYDTYTVVSEKGKEVKIYFNQKEFRLIDSLYD